jgi:hypothetical protein
MRVPFGPFLVSGQNPGRERDGTTRKMPKVGMLAGIVVAVGSYALVKDERNGN